MYIDIGHNTAAEGIVLEVVNNAVNLIKHTFLVLMFYTKLIAVGLADAAVFICPGVPDMRVELIYIVGLFLPNPENLVDAGLESCALL